MEGSGLRGVKGTPCRVFRGRCLCSTESRHDTQRHTAGLAAPPWAGSGFQKLPHPAPGLASLHPVDSLRNLVLRMDAGTEIHTELSLQGSRESALVGFCRGAGGKPGGGGGDHDVACQRAGSMRVPGTAGPRGQPNTYTFVECLKGVRVGN